MALLKRPANKPVNKCPNIFRGCLTETKLRIVYRIQGKLITPLEPPRPTVRNLCVNMMESTVLVNSCFRFWCVRVVFVNNLNPTHVYVIVLRSDNFDFELLGSVGPFADCCLPLWISVHNTAARCIAACFPLVCLSRGFVPVSYCSLKKKSHSILSSIP